MSDENGAFLPGFEPSAPASDAPGYVESETLSQIAALRGMGYIEDHHAGQVALAIVTARALDRSIGKGAASGQANLSRAMKEVFEMLPAPEAASGDALDKVLSFLMGDSEGVDVPV